MKKILLATIIILFAPLAKGQSVQQIQDSIVYYSQNIDKWDTLIYDTSIDNENSHGSLDYYNKQLLDYLYSACKNNPATLKANFKLPKYCRMNILTSDDKKFRIYYWDVGAGGGVRSSDVLAQYRCITGSKVKVLSDVSKMPEFDVFSGLFYRDLYTIKTMKGKTIYMALGGQKISAGLYIQNLQAFTVNNDTLDDSVKLFKTTKELLNDIDYSFEATLVGNNDPSIKVSNDKQKIYVPVITEEGKTTSKHIVYIFDGNNYVFDRNAK